MKKKTRILITLMGLEIGGAETHVVELCKYLSKNGYLVYVASNGGIYEKVLEKYGIKHIYAPLTSKNPYKMYSAYKIIKKAVIDNKIDLIHSHARIPAFVSSFVHKRLKVPFMTTVHGVYSTDFLFKLLTNWGQKTICVSEDIKSYVLNNYNIKEENTFVTINGIDTSKFSPETDYSDLYKEFGLTDDDFKIVYVSRLDDGNCNMAYKLLNISQKLYDIIPNAKIIMVGDGNKFGEINEKANNLPHKNVIMAGSRTDVNKFTSLSDVFIGISRAALEAMSSRNIVLLGGDPGYMGIFREDILKECFNNNFTCRNTNPLDENSLLNDIISVSKMNEDEKNKLKDFGQKLIFDKYSVKTMADDNIKVYEKLLSENNYSYDFVISGYYGFNNSGDDALLMAMINDIKENDENARIVVLSKNPKETRKLYGVDSINRFNLPKIKKVFEKSKVLLSGGGSLLQDITSTKSIWYYLSIIKYAIKKKVDVFVYANGIGPINKEKNRKKTKEILSNVNLITLRDADSKHLLNEIGVNNVKTIITADPAFSLKKCDDEKICNILKDENIDCKKNLIAISIRDWKNASKDFEKIIAQKIDDICKKYGFTPLFLPMQYPFDLEFSKKVISKLNVESYIVKKQYSGEILSGIINKCKLTIAMRLHALIYSTSANVPVFGIVYDPKVDSLLKYTDQPYCVDINEVDSQKFFDEFDNLMKNIDAVNSNLSITLEKLEQKAFLNSSYAIKLLNKEEVNDENSWN